MPLYGAAHVQLGPGQAYPYQLFKSTDSLTPPVASMSFGYEPAAGTGRQYTKTFQVILGTAAVPVSGSCTMNIQSSLVDIDSAFVTVGTITIASGYSGITTDIGNSLFYRFQLTALTTATTLVALVNIT